MLLDAGALARVVVCGVPIAGKTTLMQAFARAHDVPSSRLDIDNQGVRGIEMRFRRIQIASWTGALWDKHAWDKLIAESTHLVWVIDGQLPREEATTEMIARISKLETLPKAGCVVWTKGDLRPRTPSRVDGRPARMADDPDPSVERSHHLALRR